jgi:hypothetical protein
VEEKDESGNWNKKVDLNYVDNCVDVEIILAK